MIPMSLKSIVPTRLAAVTAPVCDAAACPAVRAWSSVTVWLAWASKKLTGRPWSAFCSHVSVSRNSCPRAAAPSSGDSWLSLALMALAPIETTTYPLLARASPAPS